MLSLLDISIRHQIFLEGLKNGRQAALAKSLADVQQQVVTLIRTVDYEDLGDMTKLELNALLAKLKKASNVIFAAWLTNLIRWLNDYINADREFWKYAYTERKTEQAGDAKTRNHFAALFGGAAGVAAIYSLAKNTPMGANGIKIEPFMSGYSNLSTARLLQAVTQAYANRDSKQTLIDAIVGTKDAGRKDGLLRTLQNQGNALTNTVTQHIAGITNAAVAKQGFDQYLWVSVLDSRTTQICTDRNGNVYVYGQGPLPPAHVNCRSSTIAWDGETGPVTMPSFTVWIKGQPKEFINAAFGGNITPTYQGSKPIGLDDFVKMRQLIVS